MEFCLFVCLFGSNQKYSPDFCLGMCTCLHEWKLHSTNLYGKWAYHKYLLSLIPGSDFVLELNRQFLFYALFLWYLWLLGCTNVSHAFRIGIPRWLLVPVAMMPHPEWGLRIQVPYTTPVWLYYFVCFLVLQLLAGEKCVSVNTSCLTYMTIGKLSFWFFFLLCQLCPVSCGFWGFWVWG